MKISTLLLVLQFIGVVGCSEPENSIKHYDSHIYKRFIAKLDKNNIEYRKGENLNVFFPVSQAQQVNAIASETNAEYHPGCGGSFTAKEKQKAMETELKKRGIPFTVVDLDKGPAITCAPENKEAFHEAFMFVLKGKSSEYTITF